MGRRVTASVTLPATDPNTMSSSAKSWKVVPPSVMVTSAVAMT
jgi:hypothetical protein